MRRARAGRSAGQDADAAAAAPKAATAAPPSQQLLDAFAILRRPRTDQDALSPEALEALRVRGLSPVSLDSSRLLRSTPSGGKAWVVPVPNVVGRLGAFCGPVGKSAAREGVVVVAVGDAASGGGGALDDLVRGRAPVTLAPCAGADHSMLSISGMVPDGVPAVFLTAPDGTAVRADVKDNGYEFLLPNQRSYEQRYVVWTGGDGTPHVQPIVTFAAVRASACKSSAKLTQSVRARVAGRACSVRRGRRSRTSSPFRCRAERRARCACAARSRPWSTSRAARGSARSRRAWSSPAARAPCRRSPSCRARPVGPAPPVAAVPARPRPRRPRRPASTADRAPAPSSLDEMAAPRPLVILTLLAVFVASVSVTILAWIAIATANKAQDVVDKADRLTTDAATSIRRLDRTTRDLDPAVRSLRRASDALNNAARATP